MGRHARAHGGSSSRSPTMLQMAPILEGYSHEKGHARYTTICEWILATHTHAQLTFTVCAVPAFFDTVIVSTPLSSFVAISSAVVPFGTLSGVEKLTL